MDTFMLAKQAEEYVVGLYRDLHEHPEIGMQEERTIQVIVDELSKLGIENEIIPHGGIIGIIEGDRPGKTIVLRADIDALPMKEEPNNLKQPKVVVSQDDRAAHTCGHDGHTAMLLGAAKILVENKQALEGKVILAFEQGEEVGGGIYRILSRLVEMGVDGIWGIHLKSDIPTGKISVDAGPRMSGVSGFQVTIKGKSGHGSRPDLSFSPVDCFTDFHQSLQAMRLKSLDPFMPITYSIGSVSAGMAANVIPEELAFSGTIRYLHYEQGLAGAEEFIRLLERKCEEYHCTYHFDMKPVARNLSVYNEETCAGIAEQAIKKAIGEDVVYSYPAWMASEPFSFYQKYFPGVFAFVGIENKEKGTGAEHHNAFFEVDEDALPFGVAATVQYAIDFLRSNVPIDYPRESQSVADFFKEMNTKPYEPPVV